MRHSQQIEKGKANIVFFVRMPYDRREHASGVASGEITVPQRHARALAMDMSSGSQDERRILDIYLPAIKEAAAKRGGEWAGSGFGVLVKYHSGIVRYIA